MPRNFWSDEKIARVIGSILQTGVLLAAALVILGGTLYLVDYGTTPMTRYTQFDKNRAAVHSPAPLFRGAAQLDGRAIIQLGILLLIATPVARVIFAAVVFWFRGDPVYVVVSLIVLAILCYSLFGGTG